MADVVLRASSFRRWPFPGICYIFNVNVCIFSWPEGMESHKRRGLDMHRRRRQTPFEGRNKRTPLLDTRMPQQKPMKLTQASLERAVEIGTCVDALSARVALIRSVYPSLASVYPLSMHTRLNYSLFILVASLLALSAIDSIFHISPSVPFIFCI